MLPIKLVRSISQDHTAKAVALGLSSIEDVTYDDLNSETEQTCVSAFKLPKIQTNDTIALAYLEATPIRRHIEREARKALLATYEETLKDLYPMGERWVEEECSKYWNWKLKRGKKRS